jgi:hypothetical protein
VHLGTNGNWIVKLELIAMLKMISREKDSGFDWKFEDYEFRAALNGSSSMVKSE